MNTELFTVRLARHVITAGAVSLLLASPAFAQGQTQQSDASTDQRQQFQTMDQDQDRLLVWREIHVALDPQILAAGLDQEQIFQQYDKNNDSAMDEQEFDRFVAGLQQAETDRTQRGTAEQAGPTDTNAGSRPGEATSQQRLTEQRSLDASRSTSMRTGDDQNSGSRSSISRVEQERTQVTSGSTVTSESNRDNTIDATEENVISRSFDDEVDLSDVSQVEAGSSRAINPGDVASSEQASIPNADEQPDGTAVIVMNGEVARTTDSDIRSAEPIDQAMDTQIGANTTQATTDTTAITSNTADRSRTELDERSGVAPDQSRNTQVRTNTQSQQNQSTVASDPRSIYIGLVDAAVINAEGEEIGSIADVVVDNESGDVGLVITTDSVTGVDAGKVVAPVEEVTLTDKEIIWRTTKSKNELRQSDEYDPENYNKVSANNPSDAPAQGISQR